MGYNVYMMMKKSMIERAATLGLAVWFAVLTVFVQGPHRHDEIEHGTALDPVQSACTACEKRADANASAQRLLAGEESMRQAKSEPDRCSICLFLKNCKERSLIIISFIPNLAPIKQTALLQDIHIASLVIDSSCPRAPPLSFTS